jgi:cell division protein FtsN
MNLLQSSHKALAKVIRTKDMLFPGHWNTMIIKGSTAPVFQKLHYCSECYKAFHNTTNSALSKRDDDNAGWRPAYERRCIWAVLLVLTCSILGMTVQPVMAVSYPSRSSPAIKAVDGTPGSGGTTNTKATAQLAANEYQNQQALDYVRSVLEEKDREEARENKSGPAGDDSGTNSGKAEESPDKASGAHKTGKNGDDSNVSRARTKKVDQVPPGKPPVSQSPEPVEYLRARTGMRADIRIETKAREAQNVKYHPSEQKETPTKKDIVKQESNTESGRAEISNIRDYLDANPAQDMEGQPVAFRMGAPIEPENKPVKNTKQQTPSQERFYIQLGAYNDRHAAERAWQYARDTYSVLEGVSRDIQRADKDARGIYYRVRGGPVGKVRARAICRAIKQKDTNGCLVVGADQ